MISGPEQVRLLKEFEEAYAMKRRVSDRCFNIVQCFVQFSGGNIAHCWLPDTNLIFPVHNTTQLLNIAVAMCYDYD